MRPAAAGAGPRTALERINWWAWLILLVSIPVTSFPLVEETVGGDSVSPLSLLPLLVLLALFLLPYLLRGGRLPAEGRPLLVFGALAFVSTLAAAWLPLQTYKDVTVLTRSVRGLATLAIGLSFYFSAALIPRNEREYTITLRALYLGGALTLLWSGVQAWFVLDGVAPIPWRVNAVHRLFSVRDLFRDRVTGFAYEPSWLGNQMAVLYLPLWLGSLERRWSPLPWRLGRVQLEWLLAIGGGLVVLLARARVSAVSLVLLPGLLLLAAAWRASGRLVARRRGAGSFGARPAAFTALRVVTLAGALVLVAGAGYGLLRLGARVDYRVARVLGTPSQLPALRKENPYEVVYALADRAAMAERLVYWRAGFEPFLRYPLLGVGLGNAGFLFEAGIPDYGYRLVEINRALTPTTPNFPNPKSLWVRLLSETGILGFAAYLTWLILVAAGALALVRAKGAAGVIGVAGALALAAGVIEGFSLDTLALPQPWILYGLVTACLWRARGGREGGIESEAAPAAARGEPEGN